MFRLAIPTVALALATLPACSSTDSRVYVHGLEPTPADQPVPIYQDQSFPECDYVLIGRVNVVDAGVETTRDGTFERREALRSMRDEARKMGGHAILITSLEELEGRMIPDPKSIEDIVPEADDDKEDLARLSDELEDRADTSVGAEDREDRNQVSAGFKVGRSGIHPENETEDRLSVEGFVIRFVDPACTR